MERSNLVPNQVCVRVEQDDEQNIHPTKSRGRKHKINKKRTNIVPNQVCVNIDKDDEQNIHHTKSRGRKHKVKPSKIHTLRYRANLKDKLENQHELQFQTLNRNDTENTQNFLEHHADSIVSKMEKDPNLMENNVESEKFRIDVLKHMPQCLTMKRCIKRKLTHSVNRKGKCHTIGYFKRLKYRMGMKYAQMKTKFGDMMSSYELWYSSLKTIEGQFGSAVSSYFRFLRWLFLLNVMVTVVTLTFIVIPQLTFKNSTTLLDQREFRISDIFTGEGFLTGSLLYYGFYSNETVNVYGLPYNMPYAFCYTMLFLYFSTFLVLSISVARSYRKSFIETEGGLRNVFAHKIFCGWDFSIATREAADLKSRSIYNELKEYISEVYSDKDDISWRKKIQRKLIQLTANVIILAFYIVVGIFLWFILDLHTDRKIGPEVVAITANIFNVIVPLLFTKIASYEEYRNPRNAVGISLIRSFILSAVIVGTLVGFWLIHSFTQECWETSLGQEMYRLILYDFIFSLAIHGFNIIHHFISRFKCCKILPNYEFDVASNTLDLIYTQSLFWMGFFFSPIMSLIVTARMFLTWYLKKYYLLKLCKQSTKSWRAPQTQTWFLTLTFISLLGTGCLILFILVRIPATNCGPFQGLDYIYQAILPESGSTSFLPLKYVGFAMKPGVIVLVIITLCARIYYVREKVKAQRNMVKMLRNMMVWESKDKEYLLQCIANLTKGEFQYNVQDGRLEDPYTTLPKMDLTPCFDSEDGDASTSRDELIGSSKFGC